MNVKNILLSVYIGILMLTACNQSAKQNAELLSADSLQDEVVVVPEDTLFLQLELSWEEVTKDQFGKYVKNYVMNCTLNPGGFISGSGLSVESSCDQICVTYLVEDSGRKMKLPSEYDQGIMGISFSPSCDQFVAYSSYDGTDYENYYQYRAEIMGYKVITGKGIDAVVPVFKSYVTEWSIDTLMWIDNQSLAVRGYKGDRSGNEANFLYDYFKTSLLPVK